MNRVLRVLLALALIGTVWSVFIGGTLLLLPPAKIAAQPPPSKSPVPPSTEPPTDPPTEPPTEPPTDPPTEPPTDPPTDEPTAPPTEEPVKVPRTEPKPDPNCESVVEGYVANAAGQRAAGAAVKVEGDGWSRGMLTGDDGHYGFGGLCAGTVTLSAVLVGGQTCAGATVSMDGHSTSQVNLAVAQGGGPQPTSTALATATRQAVPAVATPEPGMPSTGFPGWLLVGMALLGVVVLLSAGARRVFVARSQDRG